jgi:DNA repair protein RadA/Sms
MAKPKVHYVCHSCGGNFPQWFGRCPGCGTYNSLEEQLVPQETADRRSGWSSSRKSTTKPRAAVKFSEIVDRDQSRFPSGYEEFDRVLGGGIVPGSLVLIGGDPGIGKSTLLLQVAHQLAATNQILYVTGEESGQQVKLRAGRLGVVDDEDGEDNKEDQLSLSNQVAGHQVKGSQSKISPAKNNSAKSNPAQDQASLGSPANLYILAETNLEEIIQELEALRPQVAVIDSIQSVYLAALSSAPGSVSQVRECTSALMQVAKREHITLFIVGHVTKEGAIAGPRVLEHLVDTVLYFEGDRYAAHRLLRSVKNRFGATHEIGVFEMIDRGLRQVTNPSELFLGNRDELAPGTATIVACEGTRPIVLELQALVSPSSYASPRRSTTGVDYNRLQQILAVLEKRVGIPLSKLDAYVASAGGLGVEEPAADLGIAIALVASFRDRVVDPRTVIIGEIGLGGQIRLVSQLELRLREAAKLGFQRAIVPKGQVLPTTGLEELEIVPVGRLLEAIIAALPSGDRSEVGKEIS